MAGHCGENRLLLSFTGPTDEILNLRRWAGPGENVRGLLMTADASRSLLRIIRAQSHARSGVPSRLDPRMMWLSLTQLLYGYF
jgi:hypothetical protein